MPKKKMVIPLLVLSLILIEFPPAWPQGGGNSVIITGIVKDEAGEPLSRMPVLLLLERVRSRGKGNPPEILEERTISTTSDKDGFYRLAAVIEPSFNRILLRFYSNQGFDKVRYQLPEDKNITRMVRRNREFRLDRVIKENPLWEEVKARIARYGYQSSKGKVLRTRGIPDKVEKGRRGRYELWWYYEDGVCYRFLEETLDRIFKFNPIKKEGPVKPKEGEKVEPF
jgi:hypothetical protein